ncbi:MAG: glycosyltransferase family 4 protein [Chlorobium sp.]|nr:glycosyltransferase family 4 protein [Chlorobium sp.]
MKNPLNIYVDCIVFKLQRVGGISVYFSEIIQRLLSSEFNVTYIEQEHVSLNLIRKELPIPTNKILIEKTVIPKLLRYLPINIKLKQRSIVHSSYYRISSDVNAVNIVTVHDFNYEYYRKGFAKYIHSLQKRNAINKADGIICISENTKRDLLKFNAGIDSDKITVIYHGASKAFYPINKSTINIADNFIDRIINDKYILFVGGRLYYKNFNLSIDVVARLENCMLVIVGGGPATKDELSNLDEKLKNRYILIDSVSTENLNTLYNYAFCMLYPSRYEGFGIPILEAMQAGCPVVSTKESSIPEVAGNAGLLVDDICSEAFLDKILRLENVSYRASIISAGLQQAKKFTWDKTYHETIRFYCDVFNKKFGEVISVH